MILLTDTVLGWGVSSRLWVRFMALPYSFWGLGSGPPGETSSRGGSLEGKRAGLAKQAHV